ncbi:MAG: primase [Blastococcus sp.]|jgi:DNA primase|nr:primase [Blastococcus sp.]
MAGRGRIRAADIALVRERSKIDEIVGEHLQLKRAGGGSLKGLCPFHDEKSPSFQVTPTRNLYHCFGCGVGGDVISFIQNIDHLSFSEAVELLAGRAGVQLRYEDDGGRPTAGPDRAQVGQRARLVAANAAAAAFFAEQLGTPEAAPARQFLAERGFDRQVAVEFGCGFAPGGWDAMTRHLRGAGFSQPELVTAGLAKESSRGTLIDRFHRRLVWPIRDITGDVIGFGARKLMDDDQGPKYLNTPETPLYKKSTVLYGIERAKRDIAKRHQAVVVEGYTDVMACHLAGVTTAVASCGTAFGGEHISVLRRLLMDQDEFRGEVVYTFDGDAAGQAAAMKTFAEDQRFVGQTFVAVESEGRDPCELRQEHGDAAVRDLIARRTPLIAFVLKTTLAGYDLDTVEGRVAALEKTVPLVAGIKDHALRPAYARQLAGMVGNTDEGEVLERVRRLTGDGGRQQQSRPRPRGAPRTPDDAAIAVEREAVKAALQVPEIAGPAFDAVPAEAYTDPDYAAVAAAVAAAGGAAGATVTGAAWLDEITACCSRDTARALLTALAVEPMQSVGENDALYVNALMARLQEIFTVRRIAAVKGRLQRMNPVEASEEYMKAFKQLMDLEQLAISLRKRATGGLTP